ncbi:unnamed protein product, partial [Allacma fusca]
NHATINAPNTWKENTRYSLFNNGLCQIFIDGPLTVLCLPGYLGTIDLDYGEFFEKVDKIKYRWVCWDPPGYGESYPPRREFTRGYLDRDSKTLQQLMKELNIARYYVLGWSQGGATGIFLAARDPESVLKLVTIGTEAILSDISVKFYNAVKKIDFWPKESVVRQLKYYTRSDLEKMTHGMADYSTSINRVDKGEFLMEACLSVKCPALIIHADRDPKSDPKHAQILKSRIPNSEVMMFPATNHDVHLAHTEDFMNLFEKYLLTK